MPTEGISYFHLGNYAKAIPGLSRVLSQKPDHDDAGKLLSFRAKSYFHVGSYREAITDFSLLINRGKSSTEQYRFRGKSYISIGDYARGIKDISFVLKHHPEDHTLHALRAKAYVEQKAYTRAIKGFTEALHYNKNPAYNEARGRVYFKQKHYTEAIKDFSLFLKKQPNNESAYVYRGRAYHKQNNLKKAIKDFSQALKINPRNESYYLLRGDSYIRLRNYSLAIADITSVLKFDPREKSYFYSLSCYAYYKTGDYRKAISDFKKALEYDENHLYSLGNLCWILSTCPERKYRSGVLAIPYGKKVVELTEQKDPHYLESLAAAYADAGHYLPAIRTQRKSLNLFSRARNVPGKKEAFARFLGYKRRHPYREDPRIARNTVHLPHQMR